MRCFYMNCRVCKKSLFVELDFRTLFKINYTIHESCRSVLETDMNLEVIPIQNNTIKWIYFFNKVADFDYDYIELFIIAKGLKYCIENTEWSIVVWMTFEEFKNYSDITQYLFLKLGDQSIVFLNLFGDV